MLIWRKQAKQELEEAAAREAAERDLEGEASSEEIEVCVLVLFLCCCIAEGIVAWGVCMYILGVDLWGARLQKAEKAIGGIVVLFFLVSSVEELQVQKALELLLYCSVLQLWKLEEEGLGNIISWGEIKKSWKFLGDYLN